MIDQSGQATVVSNSSSRDSFVGLAGANDAPTDWEQPINRSTSKMAEQSTKQDNQTNNTSQNSTPSLTSSIPSNFPSTLIVSKTPLPILPSAGLTVPAAPTNNTVPEFLYQLTKMLTGGHNDIIEWSNGKDLCRAGVAFAAPTSGSHHESLTLCLLLSLLQVE